MRVGCPGTSRFQPPEPASRRRWGSVRRLRPHPRSRGASSGTSSVFLPVSVPPLVSSRGTSSVAQPERRRPSARPPESTLASRHPVSDQLSVSLVFRLSGPAGSSARGPGRGHASRPRARWVPVFAFAVSPQTGMPLRESSPASRGVPGPRLLANEPQNRTTSQHRRHEHGKRERKEHEATGGRRRARRGRREEVLLDPHLSRLREPRRELEP